jgi:transcriptional regulator with XRE-family HTH domain
MTTKERTLRFIAYKGLSVKKFEEMCGLSNGYINSMKSGYGNAKLSQVLRTFPELNRDWLVYGEGEMLVQSQEPTPQPTENIEFALPFERFEAQGSIVAENALVDELRAQIEKLQAKVDYLNQELGKKSAILEFLQENGNKHIHIVGHSESTTIK